MAQPSDVTVEYAPGLTCSVLVDSAEATLADVRAAILEDLDEDMLPGADWVFYDGENRIPTKQERRRKPGPRLSIRRKTGWKRKLEETSQGEEPADERSKASTSTSTSQARTAPPSSVAAAPSLAAKTEPVSHTVTPSAAAKPDAGPHFETAQSGPVADRTVVSSQDNDAFGGSFDGDSDYDDRTVVDEGFATPDQKETSEANVEPEGTERPAGAASESSTSIPASAPLASLPVDDGIVFSGADDEGDGVVTSNADEDDMVDLDSSGEEVGKKKPPRSEQDDLFLDDDDDEEEDLLSGDSDEDEDDVKMSAGDVDVDDDDLDFLGTHDASNELNDDDRAMEKARNILRGIDKILKDPTKELFCTPQRRIEWISELTTQLKSDRPQTVIGCLGSTGVGKSSLLNALLDEASVLPTSGSRGCTAAVVELVYNSALRVKSDAGPEEEKNGDEDDKKASGKTDKNEPKKVPVYRGEIEFMKLEDWNKELKVLVEECSTQDMTIYARIPEASAQADAAAAWSKIEQVYGRGFLSRFHGQRTGKVFQRLSTDGRVTKYLTPADPDADYNIIPVEEGLVEPGTLEARALLLPFGKTRAKERRLKKRWATSFRKKINDYVYRQGNGNLPQTWPLIRKVRLSGPWDVLRSGACLVDLPGVRDANAARAKVAATYLQNCSNIWIVAPIKRAVDDGSAKELLGEQFKRRLLMDGQYGNVSFICTQTDDLEATETMRDHEDVARKVEGRWEKMEELATELTRLERNRNDLLGEEDDLKAHLGEAKSLFKSARARLLKLKQEGEGSEEHEKRKRAVQEAKKTRQNAEDMLSKWREDNLKPMDEAKERSGKLQRELKTMCAAVRNEYSAGCLRADFREGLKELYRKDDDDGGEDVDAEAEAALPEGFELDVFAISSNDYLKLAGIKPQSDGPPHTFCLAEDTQIPKLRKYVHETTERYCKFFARNFVETVSDLMDRVKLVASDAQDVPTGRAAYRLKASFDKELAKMDEAVENIAHSFDKDLNHRIEHNLVPSMVAGAQNGTNIAAQTVESWGSNNRRTPHSRSLEQNGLYWSTYNATVRREGVYTSSAAGQVDMNQEILDPMERAFAGQWQATMNSSVQQLLIRAKNEVAKAVNGLTQDLAMEMTRCGLEARRLTTMMTTAKRGSDAGINGIFGQIQALSTESQRNLSRSLLPQVQERMKTSYQAALGVQRGTGTYNRMKQVMRITTSDSFQYMFKEALSSMKRDIAKMVKALSNYILATSGTIRQSFENVFSICWDTGPTESRIDPAMQAKIRACRDSLLPELNHLLGVQHEACNLVGIEREEPELDVDVTQVETWEDSIKRKEDEAKKSGNAFDLCDDSGINTNNVAVVKNEPLAPLTSISEPIDLCDSDNDDWLQGGLATQTPTRVLIKSDPDGESI